MFSINPEETGIVIFDDSYSLRLIPYDFKKKLSPGWNNFILRICNNTNKLELFINKNHVGGINNIKL